MRFYEKHPPNICFYLLLKASFALARCNAPFVSTSVKTCASREGSAYKSCSIKFPLTPIYGTALIYCLGVTQALTASMQCSRNYCRTARSGLFARLYKSCTRKMAFHFPLGISRLRFAQISLRRPNKRTSFSSIALCSSQSLTLGLTGAMLSQIIRFTLNASMTISDRAFLTLRQDVAKAGATSQYFGYSTQTQASALPKKRHEISWIIRAHSHLLCIYH